MGLVASWVAVRAKSSKTMLEILKLHKSGEREPVPESDLTYVDMKNGWHVIVRQGFDSFADELTNLEKLSAKGAVIAAFVDEHSMSSSASYWEHGQLLWELKNDPEINGLVTHGSLPSWLPTIQRDNESTYEIALQVSEQLTGFDIHDELSFLGDEPFQILESQQPSVVDLVAELVRPKMEAYGFTYDHKDPSFFRKRNCLTEKILLDVKRYSNTEVRVIMRLSVLHFEITTLFYDLAHDKERRYIKISPIITYYCLNAKLRMIDGVRVRGDWFFKAEKLDASTVRPFILFVETFALSWFDKYSSLDLIFDALIHQRFDDFHIDSCFETALTIALYLDDRQNISTLLEELKVAKIPDYRRQRFVQFYKSAQERFAWLPSIDETE